MQSVSEEYLAAIVAQTREIRQRVLIEFVGNAEIGATVTVLADEGDAEAAPKEAVVDGMSVISKKYAIADGMDDFEMSLVYASGTSMAALIVFGEYFYMANNGPVISYIKRSSDGLNWSLMHNLGFGGDEAYTSFCEFDGYLYAGTSYGNIYRSADGENWVAYGTGVGDSVESLCEFNGNLYAGTGTSGAIYQLQNDGSWDSVYPGPGGLPSYFVDCMYVFGAYLYAGINVPSGEAQQSGRLYQSANGTSWTLVYNLSGPSAPRSCMMMTLVGFGNYLYVGVSDGTVRRSANGIDWAEIATLDTGAPSAFAIYQDRIIAGTGDSDGLIYESSDGILWYQVYDTEDDNIYSVCQFGDDLYAGSGPGGKLFQHLEANDPRMYPADDLYPMPEGLAWFGEKISDDDCAIGTGGQELALVYGDPIPVYFVRWASDDWLGGRPVDFVVEYYDGANWIEIADVTDWASEEWDCELETPVTAEQVRITITEVNLPQCSAKLTEFEAGMALDATDLVKSWDVLRERSADSQTAPLGNSSSNQLTLELKNTDNLFYRKGGSVYAPYLVGNRKIRVYGGVKLPDESEELVPLGAYYSISWEADLDSPTARVVAWCRSKLLKETDYESSTVYVGYTISELVQMLGTAFGLADSEMVIDATTDVIPYAWFEKASYWGHLVALASAEGGQVYFDEQDRLTFENRGHLAAHADAVGSLLDSDMVIGVREGYDQSRMRNDIRVRPRALQAAASQQIGNLTDVLTVPHGDTLAVTLFYSQSPCINVQTPVLTGGAHISIASWTAYAWGGELVLSNSGGTDETVTAITVDAEPLEEQGGIEGAADDAESILLNGRRSYPIDSQYIQSYDHAQGLAEDLLPSLADPGDEITVRARGRPELQLADALRVAVARMGIGDLYQILRSRLKYDGGLEDELTLLEEV